MTFIWLWSDYAQPDFWSDLDFASWNFLTSLERAFDLKRDYFPWAPKKVAKRTYPHNCFFMIYNGVIGAFACIVWKSEIPIEGAMGQAWWYGARLKNKSRGVHMDGTFQYPPPCFSGVGETFWLNMRWRGGSHRPRSAIVTWCKSKIKIKTSPGPLGEASEFAGLFRAPCRCAHG